MQNGKLIVGLFCGQSRSCCDQNGDAAELDVVRKELKDHTEEKETSRVCMVREKNNSKRWTTFDEEENSHPNLFAPQQSYSMKQAKFSSSRTSRTSFNNSSIDKGFKYNPFFDM